ncbi:3-deoxy-D-manno-octulosonic acid transferase [Phragmitibacter flavus]|uniref:3-deoxy-D-manno-octulosonic acid transferase n=1 Tax=Phragmitibacter flavus TaxID=2576071 RepID=A0A5R8K849_9BACT|nr:3-deoxy-D-manno-octulosonic acid transferase [Phragmitibacter flavus]TLD68496.1 3-deoxy-D-manno-octulosonic acid transferase [Phragmitibacter flavus]
MAKYLLLLIYNALFPIGLVCMAPGALKKMKARGGSPRDLWQRLGFFKASQLRQLDQMRSEGRLFWIHAASVGEVGIAAKLIRQILKDRPESRFALTTTTPTGFAQVEAMKEVQAGVVLPLYSALDGWLIVRRFLRAIQPAQLILVEAEVWPNLTHACKKRGVPMYLVNARLSPRSERRFRKALPFTRAIFSMLNHVMVQEPEDVARWQSLGLESSKITCTGSIKFDPGAGGQTRPEAQIEKFQQLLRELGWGAEDPVILLASTHPGEELALAQVYGRLAKDFHDLRLIVVPRHVERAEEIDVELKAQGFYVVRRSQGLVSTGKVAVADVLLVDTTGELGAWQHLATAVIVGKSFLAKGGQNPAEAIMAGKPVLFGPHMANFEALVDQLLKKGGAVQSPDLLALERDLRSLLSSPDRARSVAVAGMGALTPHEGATARTAVLLGESLK